MLDRDGLVRAYQRLYELTGPYCARCEVDCPVDNGNFHGKEVRCCEKLYCDRAMKYAERWNVKLVPVNPDMPFLSSSGCIVPPHLRPQCTHQVCWMSARLTQVEQEEYWALRKELFDSEVALNLYPYPPD